MNKCIIFSAPSGAGKTTIVRRLLAEGLPLEFSISAATRDKRGTEENGKDYYFLSVADFKKKIEINEFIEWEEVYEDHFYGTLKSEIQRIWESGKAVIFDVDVVGGINLKKHFGENALSIFVMPPSMKALEERLKGRGTDSPERIQKRLTKAKQELITADQFDYVVLNDELEKAVGAANLIVKKFLAQ
ncbi:MAG: guanylate kinase [Vicingaceae bacterium]|jgi:guanylate kinase